MYVGMCVCMMCLTALVGDGALRLMPFQMGDPNQQWERDVQQGYSLSSEPQPRAGHLQSVNSL